jgi:hypothetical protein
MVTPDQTWRLTPTTACAGRPRIFFAEVVEVILRLENARV